jgi:hypothetical protein
VRASAPVAAGPLENEQLATLARRLIAATATGEAQWEGREPDCYRWASEDGSVRMSSRDRDGQPPYELAVFNTRDEKVDDLSSELIGDEPAAWNRALAELYRAARRNALDADEIVETLIGALRTGDRPDAEPEETPAPGP